MRRVIACVMVSLGMILGLMVASSATATTTQQSKTAAATTTTATYKRHITKIGYHTNTVCPSGQKKYFVVIGQLTAGQKFVTLRVHYLRLTNGKTLRSVSRLILTDRKAIWYFAASRYAKVSSRLAYSYTSFDAQGGATYTGVASKQCFS